MTKAEAIKATRNGAIAACVSAALTIAIVTIAIVTNAKGPLALWNDPAHAIDVVLILAFAYGMYRKSRTASILIFVYFIVAKIYIAVESQSFSGIGMALIFLYFYGKAIQGSFVYHKLERSENPNYTSSSKLTAILIGSGALVVLLILGFALLSTVGVVPSTRVQSGDEVRDADIQKLRQQGVLSVHDNVEYFYSHGLTSVLESGNVLTEDRVILYLTDEEDQLHVYELPLEEITAVELEQAGDFINDSVHIVKTNDPDRWIKLFLSRERNGDKTFVSALRKRIGE